MLDHLLFAFSAAVAQVLTNLDNLAALIALMLIVGRARAVGGFALAQLLMLGASLVVAQELSGAVPSWTGYLGVIPLTLGAVGIWRQFGKDEAVRSQMKSHGSVFVVAAIFLSMSMDSFSVIAPLLADSTPSYRLAGFLGASMAAAGLAATGILSTRILPGISRWASRLERLAPFVMVVAGIYILMNSGTDALQ